MVLSSIPGYLDPPNWHHQQSSHHHHQQQGGGAADQNPHLLLPPPPEGGGDGGVNGGGGGAAAAAAGTTSNIRPGSMSDRARQAKLPQPETALKCPRCESTNTKFCYFNNYSLTQPRHFCKTCRRYWTRGGALRSVPVGGGCRRNKRSKRSKSPASASADHHHQRHAGGGGGGRGAGSISITVSNSNNCSTTNENLLISHLAPPPPPPHHFPFLPSLHHLSDYSSGGISFAGIQQPNSGVEFHSGSSGDVGSILSTGLVAEHWRSSLQVQQGHHQQFPFSANLEPPPSSHGLFQFEGNNAANYGRGNGTQHISKPVSDSSIGANNVKMEAESQQALNMSRNFLGSLGNHHQNYWGSSGGATNTTAAAAGGISNAWTDLSGFTSSTSHLL